MNDYLREKQNQIIEQNTKNEFNEHSIFDNTKKSQYGKILYVSPPLTFPNLFLNHKDIIIDEFGLQGIPRQNKGKLSLTLTYHKSIMMQVYTKACINIQYDAF